ncbi:S24 family peptidase [Heyndrickxia sp. FSL W8-0496]|uniref:LexA family transcriptional regulator n=1 Tax=Heyndrickxia sp. FSL W8-0496 TaxID=2954702 RepID=UPI0030FC80D6
MDYSELINSYIKQSGMSLAEIAERMKNEKGVKVDRTYISKLRNNPKYAASEEINQALAEVTGGDPNRLVWAGLIYGSHPSVRDILMLIDDEVIIKAMNLMKKYPGYFNLSDEEQEEFENEPDVIDFWDSLGKSMKKEKTPLDNYIYEQSQKTDDHVYETAAYNVEAMIKIPILGCVQAGKPIEMIENNEGYTLVDPDILHGKQGFALKVKGDSMIGDRIHDGDIVIVAKQEEVYPHEIAVVAVNGDHATLKRVKMHGDMCMLIPSNPTMEPQLVPAKDVHIIGKVVEVKFWPNK